MLLVFKEEPMAEENNTVGQGDGSREYQMNRKMGTIFMLISATGMGLVPLFSRWATRTDMFDATQGLNGSDSVGAIMALGRMAMGVVFFLILMVATHKVATFKKLKLTPAIALGGLMIGMSLACYVTSTLMTTVANAVMFIYTGPVICVLLARIFRKEPMSPLQWVCLCIVFVGMLFGESLLGFGVGGQTFGIDFNLAPSTPEFPQKMVGDIFGLLSGVFYGASMFFNGYRKDADTTARGVYNFIFAVIGAGTVAILMNVAGVATGQTNGITEIHWLQLGGRCSSVDRLRSYRFGVPAGRWPQLAGYGLQHHRLLGSPCRSLHRPCSVRRACYAQHCNRHYLDCWRRRIPDHQGYDSGFEDGEAAESR